MPTESLRTPKTQLLRLLFQWFIMPMLLNLIRHKVEQILRKIRTVLGEIWYSDYDNSLNHWRRCKKSLEEILLIVYFSKTLYKQRKDRANTFSISSCRAISTDIPDTLSSPLPIVHCFRLVFRATSRIGTEQSNVGSSWSSCLCSAMWRGPQKYITY